MIWLSSPLSWLFLLFLASVAVALFFCGVQATVLALLIWGQPAFGTWLLVGQRMRPHHWTRRLLLAWPTCFVYLAVRFNLRHPLPRAFLLPLRLVVLLGATAQMAAVALPGTWPIELARFALEALLLPVSGLTIDLWREDDAPVPPTSGGA